MARTEPEPEPGPAPVGVGSGDGLGPVPAGSLVGQASTVSDAVAAIRALPHGGMDDATRRMDLPPTVRATISPAIAALRWGALGFGLAFAAPAAFRGSYAAVLATAVCLFVTTWRTVIPLKLASREPLQAAAPFLDVVALGAVAGIDGGLESPYFFCVLAAVVVLAFGWGGSRALLGLAVAVLTMVVGTAIGETGLAEQWDGQRDLGGVMVLVGSAAAAVFVRNRLLEGEGDREVLAEQVARLSEANDLLTLLNRVARTLPSSLTLREALDRTRRELVETLDARTICLLTYDDASEDWVPKLAEGCALRTSYTTAGLPEPLARALAIPEPLLDEDLGAGRTEPLSAGSGSAIYLRLDSRDRTIGLLGLEHPEPGHFDHHSVSMIDGLRQVLALTIDNARWFGRLRSLGAEEERIRIARDLHDRLGQWLTYISMELERIGAATPDQAGDLQRLHGDVQAALDELRETLRQLRSSVSDDRPFAVIGADLVHRFSERSDIAATFTAVHPEQRLPSTVENELLRILQEALTNVDRHAKAEHVDVVWDVRGGNFELIIRDDGRGFDTARGVRDSAYGLVGMRERADVIGAQISIESRPGQGTTVRVFAGSEVTREVMT